MASVDYTDFVESHNAKLVELMDKQFEQLLKAAAKNLKQHDDFKSFTISALVEMMKGGDAPEPKGSSKKGKKGAAKKASAKDDDSKPDFPKGMTEARWAKCCDLLPEREDDQFINIKTGNLVKKNARNKDYYFRGNFCAPMDLKQVVLWCTKNEPEDYADDATELEIEEPMDDSSDEDVDDVCGLCEDEDEEEDEDDEEPPRRRGNGKKGKGKKVNDDDDVLAQTIKGEDFTMKDLKALKKAAAKQKANGSYANAETRRSCAMSDRNKKNFNFFKAGYAVPKDNEELADAIKENW